MISRTKINAASDELDEVAINSIISIVRMSETYKANPAYFSDLATYLASVDGTVKAQQINAALDALEALGIGEVEINQSQTVGTDGLIYSKGRERESLVEYILGILYEAYFPSTTATDDTTSSTIQVHGDYASGRKTICFEGCLCH